MPVGRNELLFLRKQAEQAISQAEIYHKEPALGRIAVARTLMYQTEALASALEGLQATPGRHGAKNVLPHTLSWDAPSGSEAGGEAGGQMLEDLRHAQGGVDQFIQDHSVYADDYSGGGVGFVAYDAACAAHGRLDDAIAQLEGRAQPEGNPAPSPEAPEFPVYLDAQGNEHAEF